MKNSRANKKSCFGILKNELCFYNSVASLHSSLSFDFRMSWNFYSSLMVCICCLF